MKKILTGFLELIIGFIVIVMLGILKFFIIPELYGAAKDIYYIVYLIIGSFVCIVVGREALSIFKKGNK